MKKVFRLTQSGIDELKAEHETMVSQRTILADRIRQARELGDLSENAEYQSAREEQDRLEARIGELEHILQNVQLIRKAKSDGRVRLGSSITIELNKGDSKKFQIVGTMEADPLNGKISDESPIGRALLGKKVGDRAEVSLPNGKTAYIIADVS
jgi:transcription elongation factor GreA